MTNLKFHSSSFSLSLSETMHSKYVIATPQVKDLNTANIYILIAYSIDRWVGSVTLKHMVRKEIERFVSLHTKGLLPIFKSKSPINLQFPLSAIRGVYYKSLMPCIKSTIVSKWGPQQLANPTDSLL